MYSKDKLLAMLSRDNKSKRYDACEWLRVSLESSPEVVVALEKATHDADQEVAERARLALKSDVHRQMAIKMGWIEPDIQLDEKNHEYCPRSPKSLSVIKMIFLICLVVLVTLVVVFGSVFIYAISIYR